MPQRDQARGRYPYSLFHSSWPPDQPRPRFASHRTLVALCQFLGCGPCSTAGFAAWGSDCRLAISRAARRLHCAQCPDGLTARGSGIGGLPPALAGWPLGLAGPVVHPECHGHGAMSAGDAHHCGVYTADRGRSLRGVCRATPFPGRWSRTCALDPPVGWPLQFAHRLIGWLWACER